VKPHQLWGRPASGPADMEVTGSDADLAAVVRLDGRHFEGRAVRVRFRPDATSDLGRTLGVAFGSTGAEALTEVIVDVLALTGAESVSPTCAVNAVVLGAPPDRLRWWRRRSPVTVTVDGRMRFDGRASTVVVASGQYLRGADAVPRGHPGDGRAEVQVYELAPGERAPMRSRLPQGGHVPHPRIHQFSGRSAEVTVAGRPWPLEADGVTAGVVVRLVVEVRPGALRLLV